MGADRRGRSWLAVLLLALALRASVLFLPAEHLLEIGSDDACYYVVGARHLRLDGGWPTMDGVHETSGFHPLFMLLVAGLDALAARAGADVLRLVTGVNLLLGLGAGVVAVAIARTGPGRRQPAWLAGAVVLWSPVWIGHGVLGVENMLSAFALGMVMWRLLRRIGRGARDPGAWPAGAVVGDGLWLGLAGLARTDSALAAMGVAAALLAIAPRGQRWRAASRVALLAATALVVALPWLILLLSFQGSVLQDSARALLARTAAESGSGVMLLSAIAKNTMFWLYRLLHVPVGLATGALLLGVGLRRAADAARALRARASGTARPAPTTGTTVEGTGRAGRSLEIALIITLLVDGFGVFLRANSLWNIRDRFQLGVELAVVVAVTLVGFRLAGPSRTSSILSDRVRWWTLLLAPILPVAAYYIVVFRHFQLWYASAATLLLLAAAARLVTEHVGARARPVLAALLAAIAIGGAVHLAAAGTYRRFLDPPPAGAALRDRLRAALPPDAGAPVLGSFDSGQLSYRVWPYPVANLDGVMSHDAAVALATHRYPAFLEASGLRYVTGDSSRVAHFAAIAGIRLVPAPDRTRAAGLPIYRVVPLVGTSAPR